ncbi:carboxypeptidase-like regulatory domain-containing protein [Pontibacter litorisediminis]|uniref:carboxypeptidase-like regulatory domain-containing protein n=1 Tax=Pontibacter litorisediminis TaxID=1846260 RepID=UPI0023EBBA31|nr:carboxypeptidase-like regulatory domain-containing protein [Pontibacter litorisediminis]
MLQRICFILFLLFPLCTMLTHGQQAKVSGIVLQPDRKTPVIGAGISRLGTGTVVATDQSGRFTLLAQPGDSILVRAVGFKPVLYRIRQEQELLFVLQEEVQRLREVEVSSTPTVVKRPPENKPAFTPPPPVPPSPPSILWNPVSYFSKEGKQRRKLRKYLAKEADKRQLQEAERLKAEQEKAKQDYNRFFKNNTGYQ